MQNSEKKVKDYFKQRFGINKEFWEDYNFYKKGNSIWTTSKPTKKYKKFQSAGIRTLRETNLGPKPTTYILQYLGEKINKNVFRLTEETFTQIILNRKKLGKQEFGFGYIAFYYKQKIIGCGLQDKEGIKTQIPKGRTRILKSYLKR